jgi:Terminase large subunit, ATPase domain
VPLEVAAEAEGVAATTVRGWLRRGKREPDGPFGEFRTVTHPRLGSRMRVLAADVATADGTLPTLALVEELHRHKSPELYTLLRDGLFKRGGRMVTISTAGIKGESPPNATTRLPPSPRSGSASPATSGASGPRSRLITPYPALVGPTNSRGSRSGRPAKSSAPEPYTVQALRHHRETQTTRARPAGAHTRITISPSATS